MQVHNPCRWKNYFGEKEKENGGLIPYFASRISHMMPLLTKVVGNTPFHKKILETGCGTAFNCIWLSHYVDKSYEVYGIDANEHVLEYARRNIDFFRSKAKLLLGDLFKMDFPNDYFYTVFSDGVLEHFDDEKIVEALNEQYRISRYVIFSVPTYRARGRYNFYGDERLLKIKSWEKIIIKSKWQLKEIFPVSYSSRDSILRA